MGLHVWFDPRVEHLVLLEGPDPELVLTLDAEWEFLDTPGQPMLPWKGDSVSGRGKREASRKESIDVHPLDGDRPEDLPF